jgi:hypothetical protein
MDACRVANRKGRVQVRDEELEELDFLLREACYLQPVQGGSENSYGKVNIMLQAYISVSKRERCARAPEVA